MGLVTRDHLMVLLRRLSSSAAAAPSQPQISYEELNQQHVSAAARSLISQQQNVALQVSLPHPPKRVGAAGAKRGEAKTRVSLQGNGLAAEAEAEQLVEVSPYINTSAVSVLESFSIERAYYIFCTMGLRHLTVVDENNRVKGIVTRKVGAAGLLDAPGSLVVQLPVSGGAAQDLVGYNLDAAVSQRVSLDRSSSMA